MKEILRPIARVTIGISAVIGGVAIIPNAIDKGEYSHRNENIYTWVDAAIKYNKYDAEVSGGLGLVGIGVMALLSPWKRKEQSPKQTINDPSSPTETSAK